MSRTRVQLKKKIVKALEEMPMTIYEVSKSVDCHYNTAKDRLKELEKDGVVETDGDKWKISKSESRRTENKIRDLIQTELKKRPKTITELKNAVDTKRPTIKNHCEHLNDLDVLESFNKDNTKYYRLKMNNITQNHEKNKGGEKSMESKNQGEEGELYRGRVVGFGNQGDPMVKSFDTGFVVACRDNEVSPEKGDVVQYLCTGYNPEGTTEFGSIQAIQEENPPTWKLYMKQKSELIEEICAEVGLNLGEVTNRSGNSSPSSFNKAGIIRILEHIKD